MGERPPGGFRPTRGLPSWGRLLFVFMELQGKVIVITGASRGIGRYLAAEVARRGAQVVIAARTVDPKRRLPGTVGQTVAAIQDEGGTAIAAQVDVSRVGDLERLIAMTIDTFGRLDVLVNNAAETQSNDAPIDKQDHVKWRQQFDVNVHAPFILMGLAVPHLRAAGGGIIVNVTSSDGDLRPAGTPGTVTDGTITGYGTLLGYATTKAALNRLSNAVAPDLIRDNIAVVAVDPGFTRTELVDLLGEDGYLDATRAAPMAVPVATIIGILTAPDPMVFTGKIVRAQSS
jgi:NAD(P)-dependent dehydrogenase (short-subunit alcohol dehydrogenase family)